MVYDKAQKSFFAEDSSRNKRSLPRFKGRPTPQSAYMAPIAATDAGPAVPICNSTLQKLNKYALPQVSDEKAASVAAIAVKKTNVQDTAKTPARQLSQPAAGKENTILRSSQSDAIQWKCSPVNGSVPSTEKLTIDEVFEIYQCSPAPLAAQTPIRKRPAASPAGDLWSRADGQRQLPFFEFDLSPQPERSPKIEAKRSLRRSTSLPSWSIDNDPRKRRKLTTGTNPLRGMMEQVQASLLKVESTSGTAKATSPLSQGALPIRPTTDMHDTSTSPAAKGASVPVPALLASDDFSDSLDDIYLANLEQIDAAVQDSLSVSHSAQPGIESLSKEPSAGSTGNVLTDPKPASEESDYEFDLGMDDEELLAATQHLEQHYKATQQQKAVDVENLLAGIDEDEFADFNDEDLDMDENHHDISIHTVTSSTMRSFMNQDKQRQEKVLELVDAKGVAKIALLRDDWIHAQVGTGETLRLHGLWQSPSCYIATNTQGMVIIHPDILVSATSVADAHNCIRKAVLQDRVKATSQLSLPLLYGSMLHEILQQSLVGEDFSDKAMRAVVDAQIAANMESLYLLQHSVEAAKDYLYDKVLLIQQWAYKYVGEEIMSAAEPIRGQGADKTRLQQVALGVKAILETEERFWSPLWGLKGNVDVTASMHVSIDDQVALHAAPLEFKTGNATRQQSSHRAQTMLYTLMMSDRYGIPVTAGYLYYLETCQVTRVTALHNEVRGLMQMRNDVASFMKYKKLPDMLRNPFACKNCYAAEACFTYHRAFDQGTGETSGLDAIFEGKTKHLTTHQLEWFNKWEQLITKEEGDMYRFRHELWQLSSSEREAVHRCFGQLHVVPGSEQQSLHVGKMNQWTYQLTRQTPGATFIDSQIAEREPIVISDEEGHYALSCGFVTRMTPTVVTVEVDRPLRDSRRPLPGFDKDNNQLYKGTIGVASHDNPVLYRLDRDEFKNGMAMVRNNLIQLLLPPESKHATVSTERLRDLIVDLAKPLFDKCPLTCPSRVSQSSLNVDQIKTKDQVMRTRDYALVLGMPGTGKTTTIATIIRSLIAAGKSVLLTSYTHSAVDTILLKLKTDVKILRLGALGKIHPEVLEFVSTETHTLQTFEQLEKHYSDPSVVATTCLSIQHALFQTRRFDYCIVDEASQITLPVCLGPLRFADKFILVGDHFQLPPLVKDREALAGGLDVSLFKLLSDAHPEAVVNLEHQYRMNADIMSIANELIYDGMLKCGTPQIAAQQLELDLSRALDSVHAHGSCHTPCWFDSLLSPTRSVAFLNTDDVAEAKEMKRGDQTQNAVESMLIAQIVASLVAGGVAQHAIGVISPYRSQLKLLHADLAAFPHVMVDTADKFQGRDKECILVSFVRSNSTGQIGDLLKDWRRINVALTRAKRKLICIGSQETLAHDALLNKFVHLVHRRGWSIDLPSDVLQQHFVKQPVSTAEFTLSKAARMHESCKENREPRKRNSPKVMHAGERVLFKNGARPILRDLRNEMT